MVNVGSDHRLAEVSDVSVRFKSGAMGLHEASMEVAAGEIVALCGANGAGKTTLVRTISGFVKAESTRVVNGTVRVMGADVTNQEPYQVSRLGVHVIPERRKVFPNLSVGENLNTLGGLPSRAVRAERLEQIFQVFPDLRGRMGQAAGRLSGGQQQMLAIARALMADAKLLVIDEIALGLHPSLLAPLFDVIRQIVGTDRAAIIVHEDVRFSPTFADRYYLIDSGRIVEDGLTSDLEQERSVTS